VPPPIWCPEQKKKKNAAAIAPRIAPNRHSRSLSSIITDSMRATLAQARTSSSPNALGSPALRSRDRQDATVHSTVFRCHMIPT
jgi:hypothetical protein